MTARQHLDRAVLRVTGSDIRLVGNWSKLYCLQHSAAAIAEAIGVDLNELNKCRDIADILERMEKTPLSSAEREHETQFEFTS